MSMIRRRENDITTSSAIYYIPLFSLNSIADSAKLALFSLSLHPPLIINLYFLTVCYSEANYVAARSLLL